MAAGNTTDIRLAHSLSESIVDATDAWDSAVQNGIANDPDAALAAGNEMARLLTHLHEIAS